MEFYEKLFQALKNDDVKQFRSCMETNHCGSLRLGRFPVLSVMYLYNSRRLLFAYEKSFLKHNSWQDIGEPMELSVKFRDVAGKCLRLYFNETVSPVEMLLLLNRDFKLRRVFAKARVTPPVKQRLKDIYYIKWGLQAEFARNKIMLQSRPLTRSEKLRWLTASLCVALCVALVVGTPFVVNVFSSFIPDRNGVVNVTRLEQIRFRSNKIYALSNNVTLSDDFFVQDMNCELRGNGHTVTVKGDGVFGSINGKLTNIVFATNGYPIAQKVAEDATVDNVTVNANVTVQTDKGLGFFANENDGSIQNVTVNVTGALSAVATSSPFNCGGVVALNNKNVKNCLANYNGFALRGQAQTDASFGGIVGVNNSITQDCVTTGDIVADTFDVAGICAENNYGLLFCVNRANVTQSANTVWNPLIAGVVLMNNYGVEYCENHGSITSISNAVETAADWAPCAYAAGIASRAYGYVYACLNMGGISAQSKQEACAGGIVGASCVYIEDCLSMGSVEATGNVCYVGGILGYSFGVISDGKLYFGRAQWCVADCEVSGTKLSATSLVAVGGIIGFMDEGSDLEDESVFVGGTVVYCYFTGNVRGGEGVYVGAIVGVVGVNFYLASASEDNIQNKHFYNNMYVKDCGASSAFGIGRVDADNYTQVKDADVTLAELEDIKKDNDYRVIMHVFGYHFN